MTVIGADHDVVLAGIFENVRQIVVGLASDIYMVVADDVLSDLPMISLHTSGQFDAHVGNPLRSDFDKTEAQFGKFLRYAVVDDGVTGREHRNFEASEAALPFKQLYPVEVSRGSVNTNRQIRFFRRLIKRKEKGMAKTLVVD